MNHLKIFLALALSLVMASVAFGAETYNIDLAHSSANFSVRHLVINSVRGRFTNLSGSIIYDENNIANSSVEIVIKADSINTDNKDRDKHLRSADFFDVEKYPDITFKSTSVKKKGKGYLCTGTLTMHGVSKEITIPFMLFGKIKDARGNVKIGVEGSLTLNRLDYGIAWSRTLDSGGLVVGNEVRIDLNIEAGLKK